MKFIFHSLGRIVILLVAIFVIGFLVFFEKNTLAAMSSTNYKVTHDVLGSGGVRGTSTNYNLTDTIGEGIVGPTSSTNYNLEQGFWHSGYYSTLNCPASVTMNTITGDGQSDLSGNTSVCNIVTDNPGGYKLYWKADSATMGDGGSHTIDAYVPTVVGTPEVWSVGSSETAWGAHLGAGSDVYDSGKWGIGDSYATGKWLNVDTSDYEVINSSDATTALGDDEIIFWGGEVGTSVIAASGTYSAGVTITLILQ